MITLLHDRALFIFKLFNSKAIQNQLVSEYCCIQIVQDFIST